MNTPTLRTLLWTLVGGMISLLASCGGHTTATIKTISIEVDSVDQIVVVEDSLVKPIIYTNLPSLNDLPVEQSKTLFISALLPSILIARHQLMQSSARLTYLAEEEEWEDADSTFYLDLKSRYKATDLPNLLVRMKPLPNSIVLAQAAMESGWGQSRFFREANNVFGIWSYNSNEARIRAGKARGDSFVYVRAYEDIVHAISDYYRTLGSARAYRGLRQANQETDNPLELLPYLRNYSEKRMRYVSLLRTMITKNDLTKYDHYQIDPEYIDND